MCWHSALQTVSCGNDQKSLQNVIGGSKDPAKSKWWAPDSSLCVTKFHFGETAEKGL